MQRRLNPEYVAPSVDAGVRQRTCGQTADAVRCQQTLLETMWLLTVLRLRLPRRLNRLQWHGI